MIRRLLSNYLVAPGILQLLMAMMIGAPVLVSMAVFYPDPNSPSDIGDSVLVLTFSHKLALILSSLPLPYSAFLLLLRKPAGRAWCMGGFLTLNAVPYVLASQFLTPDQALITVVFCALTLLVGYYYLYHSQEMRRYFPRNE